MTDRAPRTDGRIEVVSEVNNRVVLNVTPLAHDDPPDVATEYGTVKHTGVRTQRDVSHDGGTAGNEERAAGVGSFCEMGGETIVDGHEERYGALSAESCETRAKVADGELSALNVIQPSFLLRVGHPDGGWRRGFADETGEQQHREHVG